MRKVREGDQVEATLKGKAITVNPLEVLIQVDKLNTYWAPVSSVTVVDNPLHDPIGTVRRTNGAIYVRRDSRYYPWTALDGNAPSPTAELLTGSEIIGAVPGTPAAGEEW